jgi:hypothetical protein
MGVSRGCKNSNPAFPPGRAELKVSQFRSAGLTRKRHEDEINYGIGVGGGAVRGRACIRGSAGCGGNYARVAQRAPAGTASAGCAGCNQRAARKPKRRCHDGSDRCNANATGLGWGGADGPGQFGRAPRAQACDRSAACRRERPARQQWQWRWERQRDADSHHAKWEQSLPDCAAAWRESAGAKRTAGPQRAAGIRRLFQTARFLNRTTFIQNPARSSGRIFLRQIFSKPGRLAFTRNDARVLRGAPGLATYSTVR